MGSRHACRIARVVLADRTIRRLLGEGRIEIDPVRRSADPAVERRRPRRPPLPRLPQRAVPVHRREAAAGGADGAHLGGGRHPFILHPGEFVLGTTLERVRLPDDLVARLEGKSSLGRLGLLIHSTAGFIDPGWNGQVTLELSNVSTLPITIYAGMKIGQVSFMQMSEPASTLRERRPRLEVPGSGRAGAVALLEELRLKGGHDATVRSSSPAQPVSSAAASSAACSRAERRPRARPRRRGERDSLAGADIVEGDVTRPRDARRCRGRRRRGRPSRRDPPGQAGGLRPRDRGRNAERPRRGARGRRTTVRLPERARPQRAVARDHPLLPRQVGGGAGRDGLGPRVRDPAAELRLQRRGRRLPSSRGWRGAHR